jgi:hypothetical protein
MVRMLGTTYRHMYIYVYDSVAASVRETGVQ